MQSALATTGIMLLPLRLSGGLGLVAEQKELLVDCGEGVRLRCLHSRHAGGADRSRRLVFLIHGWHGEAASPSIVSTGEYLYRAGYDVARVNLRDHGSTSHLNEGIFHANLVGDMIGAMRAVAEAAQSTRISLVGFSLGASFALRLALRAPLGGLEIERVVAINPPLRPWSALQAIDRSPMYRRYFLRRWKRSLIDKQTAFPRRYDFTAALGLDSVCRLTEEIVLRHTGFRAMEDYFDGCDLTGSRLAELKVATTILTSEDDPIVDVGDFRNIPANPALRIDIHPQGGHCGYIEGPRLRPWLDELILSALTESAADESERRAA